MASSVPVPFTNIALSLSGGGYRATTFHLGAMAYLNAITPGEETLLERVKILSTISGGTLTGVMYAYKMAQGGSFQDCFDKLYELLEKDELVEHALHKLNYPGKWQNKHKSRDVINAFAEVYNEHFYDGATFATLYNNPKSHLDDIIFGASEFSSGLQFRFQEEHDDGKFGNGNYSLPISAAQEIRLADAAAASSCFPGGFEPMVMPKDFGNGPTSAVNKAWVEKDYVTTGIMDGGILDNQGIEGVRLAEKRHANRIKGPFVGTYIVSDVAGEKMEPYQVPILEHRPMLNNLTIRGINWIAGVLSVLLVAGLVFWDEPRWFTVGSASVLTIFAIWFLTFLGARSALRQEITRVFAGQELPHIMQDLRYIVRTPIYILIYLVKFRATSVLKMVTDLFLRRIRQLQLTALHSSDSWRGRLKVNNIYKVKKLNPEHFSQEFLRVVHMANNMPTTLWFTEKEEKEGMLDALIACGQLTLCLNLMEYGNQVKSMKYRDINIWDELTDEEKAEIETIHKMNVAAWERFKEDPYWLLKELKGESKNLVA